jgi:gamma-glutamylputrescine oxidase
MHLHVLWHDPPATARPPLTRDITADVCVIGLGGSGLAAVREARALGASVVGLDATTIAGGAAGRNGGFLLGGMAEFHHDACDRWGYERATALYRHTLDAMAEMRADAPDATWWRGSLRIADDAAEVDDCSAQQSRMALDGLRVEWYEGPEGRGLLFPDDGACHPVRRARHVADRAEAAGARLFEGTSCTGLTPGAVFTSTGAVVRAPHVLVCADGALGDMVPSLARRVRPVRLQMLATAPAPDVQLGRPVYARYGYDYWQQLPDGRVVLGGGRDQFHEAEFTRDASPSADVQRHLEQRLRRAVGTTAAVTHRWAATVSYSDDALPIAEHVGDGCWAAGAYNGTGNVVGTLCARGIARRALGYPDNFLDLLDSLRAQD